MGTLGTTGYDTPCMAAILSCISNYELRTTGIIRQLSVVYQWLSWRKRDMASDVDIRAACNARSRRKGGFQRGEYEAVRVSRQLNKLDDILNFQAFLPLVHRYVQFIARTHIQRAHSKKF